MFLAYLRAGDFPAADMARVFLQMSWTRAQRYAYHRGGRKYDKVSRQELPTTEDAERLSRQPSSTNCTLPLVNTPTTCARGKSTPRPWIDLKSLSNTVTN